MVPYVLLTYEVCTKQLERKQILDQTATGSFHTKSTTNKFAPTQIFLKIGTSVRSIEKPHQIKFSLL